MFKGLAGLLSLNCYAERLALRLQRMGNPRYRHGFDLRLHHDWVRGPGRWKRPRRVFVCSMSDLFHEAVPDEFLGAVFWHMERNDQHTYQILTKRPLRMFRFVSDRYGGCRPQSGIWLGVSVENQVRADERIPVLLATPGAVRFVSVEPQLEAVDLTAWMPHFSAEKRPALVGGYGNRRVVRCDKCGARVADVDPARSRDVMYAVHLVREAQEAHQSGCAGLSWVICGGESGPERRPFDKAWARSLRDQCQRAGVPFMFKQGSAYRPGQDRELDGRTWDEMP